MHNINTKYCQPANLIPHFWFQKIVDKENRPDLPCIVLLSEVFGWFRNLPASKTYYSTGNSLPELVNGKLAISYDYLSGKLNFQKERIRKNFVKLERLKVLSREVKNIALEDGSRINQLYISIDQQFFKDCFRDPEFDIRVRDEDFLSGNNSNQSLAFQASHLLDGEHIRKKTKTRSIDLVVGESKNLSNFLENDFKEEQQATPVKKSMRLADFYPLSAEDCSALQGMSGREFSLNAMNEILKNMSKRLADRLFYSKRGFLGYMSQAFRYEKRDAAKINNTDFRIRANLDSSEQTLQIQEKYLTELEYSLQVSPEWHFKKKLASVLERNKAYNLLTSYKGLELEDEGVCKLILTKHVTLTENEQDIILSQVQATHYGPIEILTIEMPEKSLPQVKFTAQTTAGIKARKSLGIWGEVRSALVKSLGDQGEAIDNHWLSKLNANIDKQNNKIELKAPSEFVKSYIEERLWPVIVQVAKQSGFELSQIRC
jgi:hypothetical protein